MIKQLLIIFDTDKNPPELSIVDLDGTIAKGDNNVITTLLGDYAYEVYNDLTENTETAPFASIYEKIKSENI